MVHFAEINQASPPYSMLQYIGRVYTRKLSQILANNIDNRGRGIGLRIYVRYCSMFPNIFHRSMTYSKPMHIYMRFDGFLLHFQEPAK